MKTPFPQKRKEHAYKQLYEMYYAPFCLYAKRYIKSKEIREDIVSDVFVMLWNKIDSFDMESNSALGYIKMCVKNSCLNYLKHQEYEWNYAEAYQQKPPLYESEADSIYTLEEMYKMLYDTLEQLPDNYRTVFMKSFFEGATQTEIAKELNISEKSVSRYKQKTLELLQKELKDYLPLLIVYHLLS